MIQDDADTAEAAKTRRMVSIETFSELLKGKRKAAIDGRRASGIETIWSEDEDHYDGIDAINRDDSSGYTKPSSSTSGLISKPKQAGRSTVFLKITRPYCDAASARVADMLLPTDDRNWALRPTPKPELIKALEDKSPVIGPDGQPVMAAAPAIQQQQQPAPPGVMSRIGGAISGMFGGGQPPGQPQPPARPLTKADQAQQVIARAKERSEAAQNQIDDWLVECRYHAEVRKVIDSAARTGTGILKGPIPVKRVQRAAKETPDGFELEFRTETKPSSVYVRNWDFYPDPNCGDNIQRGSYTWERDDITARKLRDLKGTTDLLGNPIYIDEMIDLCLEEGPASAIDEAKKAKDTNKVSDDDLYEIWYFHGQVTRQDMEAAGCQCSGDKESYPCTVTMVNDRVIKISLSPLDCGEFPYDVMVWQARLDSWAGYGVARQMRECQKGANAAVRNLMDNAGLSAGPQIIIDSSKIEPANKKWEVVPRKIWRKKTGVASDMNDVRQAFTIVTIETRQAELMNILTFWLKEAEDVTGLPMLLQGQQGKAPDTVGGMTMMSNNASGVLRRLARIYDDRVTESHIGRYYEWLLMHGPEECKGDFTIDARGSSALVERDMQNQAMMQMLGVSLNPAYALDPELTVKEVLKGMRLDPKRFELSDEKKQQMASRKPPEDPRITAAKIRAEADAGKEQLGAKVDMTIAQMENQTAQARIRTDTDRDTAYVQAEAQKNAQDAEFRMRELIVKRELALLEYANQNKLKLDDIKADLAKESMRLNVQRELSAASGALDLHKHHTPQVATPAVEPAGRAPAGQGFQQ